MDIAVLLNKHQCEIYLMCQSLTAQKMSIFDVSVQLPYPDLPTRIVTC